MTRKRIPCTLWSRVIGPSSHSGSLGRVVTLGKIGPMAFFFVHEKCQHYYESGQSSAPAPPRRPTASTQNFGYRTEARRSEVTVTNPPVEATVTRASLREYAAVQRERSQQASRADKHRLLDEMVRRDRHASSRSTARRLLGFTRPMMSAAHRPARAGSCTRF